MKKIIIVVIWICSSCHLYAQSDSRLIAFSFFGADTSIAPTDTGWYFYAAGKGGEITSFSKSTLNADYPFDFVDHGENLTGRKGYSKFDSAYYVSNLDTFRYIQTFDGGNNIINFTGQKKSVVGWDNYIQYQDSFDNNHNLLQHINAMGNSSGAWVNGACKNYSYDAEGRLSEQVTMLWNASAWQNSSKGLYYYDGESNLVKVEGYSWNSTASTWQYNSTRNYYYTAGVVDSFILTGVPGIGDIGVYSFSPLNDTMTLKYYDGISNYLTIINTYDAHHNKTSITQISDSAHLSLSLETYRITFDFNTHNQVVNEREYHPDLLGNWIFNSLNRYYYEGYTDKVNDINNPYTDLQIYPVPAQDMITVKFDSYDTEPFALAIYDMQGKQVRKWNEQGAGKFQKTLSLAGLPHGSYVVKVTSDKYEYKKLFSLLD